MVLKGIKIQKFICFLLTNGDKLPTKRDELLTNRAELLTNGDTLI